MVSRKIKKQCPICKRPWTEHEADDEFNLHFDVAMAMPYMEARAALRDLRAGLERPALWLVQRLERGLGWLNSRRPRSTDRS